MLRVVINDKHGGFGLSAKAILWLMERGSTLIKTATLGEYGIEETVEQIKQIAEDDGYKFSHVDGDLYACWYGSALVDVAKGVVHTANVRTPYNENDWQLQTIRVRTHPDLITVVETLGEEASGQYASLKIVDIPDIDVSERDIQISEYDGAEWVAERHRTWS